MNLIEGFFYAIKNLHPVLGGAIFGLLLWALLIGIIITFNLTFGK